jgi:hypothetical protein
MDTEPTPPWHLRLAITLFWWAGTVAITSVIVYHLARAG